MSDYFLGIEWTGTQFKILALGRVGKKFVPAKFDRLEVQIKNEQEAAGKLRNWILENLPSKAEAQAALTLPESLIFFKELELPKVKDKQLDEAIFWEISSVVPIPPDEAVLQWKKIEETRNTVYVLAMAVRSGILDSLLRIFKNAGVQLLIIEPSSIAAARVAKANFGKTTLLLQGGADETNVVLLKNGVPVFSRTLSVPLTVMKKKRRKLERRVSEAVAGNVKQVISFWETNEKGKIEQVIITGDVAAYYGLATAVNRVTHLPIGLAKPKALPNIEIKTNLSKFHQYLVSLGAASRLLWEDPFVPGEVNLFPKIEKALLEKEGRQRQLLAKLTLFAWMNLVFLLIFLLLLAGMKIWNFSLKREITQTRLTVLNHPAQKVVSSILFTNKLLEDARSLSALQKDTGDRLRRIASLTHPDVSFTAIEYSQVNKEEWKITGVGDRDDILAFYEKLRQDSGASQVSMPYSNLAKETDNEFTITLIW